MAIQVLVNGATGRMGQLVVKAIANESALKLVGQLSHHDDLSKEIEKTKAQVVVDFTQAEVVLKNAQTIINAGVHPVIGTSGLLTEQIQQLQTQSAQLKLGGIIAPNFSIGAVLMMKCAQEAAKYFSQVEIIEMHHDGKLDSPSGTAMRSAELIAYARSTTPKQPTNTRETVPGARGASYQHIPVHSIRLPGLVAHQQILFGGLGETLTFKHDSIDRQCFMPGVILACLKVVELKELIYGLESLLV
jgi:4-hydroxy-tetrahydrodipicolinate reductase